MIASNETEQRIDRIDRIEESVKRLSDDGPLMTVGGAIKFGVLAMACGFGLLTAVAFCCGVIRWGFNL